MQFNAKIPNVLCLDINSCFATIEQQANPTLRYKPIAVAAYDSPGGCILAASVDAKKLGIKTGMRVGEAKKIYPRLVVLLPDHPKYRYVHKKLKKILKDYSAKVVPKSIDEFVFDLPFGVNPQKVAVEIKNRIKTEVGEYITVSIGIGPNRYLAKTGSDLQKPDGLVEINKENCLEVFSKMELTDLKGIKKANAKRLKRVGINTVLDFYNAPVWKLKLAFGGIGGLYWHLRLHGYEIDNFKSVRKTYGNSYAPPLSKASKVLEILSKLCQKTGFRLRSAGLGAYGVHLSILFRRSGYWHKGSKTKKLIFDSGDIYQEALDLFKSCTVDDLPRIVAVNVFNLVDLTNLQLSLWEDVTSKFNLTKSMDQINRKWGSYTIYYGRMSQDPKVVQDRIAFGNSEV